MDNEGASNQKKPPYKPLRFFLSSLNTYSINQIVQSIRNDQVHPSDPNLIVGTTINNSTLPVPEGVRKVINPLKISFLQKVILDSDVIIYDINTCDHQEAEFAIKVLKLGDYETEKLLIIISSVMVWSDTPPKEKKLGEEDDPDQLPPDSDDDLDKPKPDNEEDQPIKKEYVRFTEADYARRRPLPQYEALRSIESMCLALNRKNLLPFILCSGILYGVGEQHFQDHFRQAWLQQPIFYYGSGRNRVPTIHVKDLALFVAKVVEKPPPQRYIFAIDHNQNPQQKKLIESISKGIGCGKVESQAINENNVFTIDIRMKPTKAFDSFLEEAASAGDEVDEGSPNLRFTFNWWCKEGLRANIAKIRLEFLEIHKLKPIKILVTGPPAVGKSSITNSLSNYYQIPKINVKQLIQEYFAQNNEEVENMKVVLEDTKRTLVEEAQQQYEIMRKKRKQLQQPYIPFDDSQIEPRLNDEQLNLIYKWRLMQNDCQNRGFILDGFPKTYAQAKQLFQSVEGEGDEQKTILNKLILPDHILHLQGSTEDIMDQIMKLPQHSYSEEHLQKRFQIYNNINVKKGHPLLLDFFKELKIEICEIQVFNNQSSIFLSTRSYIERFGPFNYYSTQTENEEFQRLKERQEIIRRQLEKKQIFAQELDELEDNLRKIQEEEYKIKKRQFVDKERKLLEQKSELLSKYLEEKVVQHVIDGLKLIVKTGVENPVEFLAEFLFKRSPQVKSPDPQRFFEQNME